MEDWMRNHILQNLPTLIEATACHACFLSIFLCLEILSNEEVEEIEISGSSYAKSRKLYQILLQRKGSYQALISALHHTYQSCALIILMEGFMSHGSVKFQDNFYSVSELLPNQKEIFSRELMLMKLKSNFLCIDDVVVIDTIPSKREYYIPREIVSHTRLDSSIFQAECSDVFLFQGLECSELSLLDEKIPIDVSTNLLDQQQMNTRYIRLDSADHYDIIVLKTKEPVHLIQHTNGAYQWLKSRGSVQTIQKFVDKTPCLMAEEALIEKILSDNLPICLTGSPGMGKTLLLENIARALLNRFPQRLVMFVSLQEFIPDLQAKLINGTQLDGELVQALLSEHVSVNPVGRCIVSNKLVHDRSHLCFDGFDEVPGEQKEVTKAMLKMIATTFPNCQTLVTARLDMQEELEQTMGTLGFHIAPFNNENQIEFLTKLWKSRGAKVEGLTEFAETCFATLAAERNEDKQKQTFAGLPLQCCVIGEFFADSLHSCTLDLNLKAEAEVLIKYMAPFYDALIIKNLDIFKVGCFRESVIQTHMYAAITLLFPDEISNFVESPLDTDIRPEQICHVDEKIRFVNLSFAKYFVALFTAKLLGNLDHESLKGVLKSVLGNFVDNPLGRHRETSDTKGAYQHPFAVAYFVRDKSAETVLPKWENAEGSQCLGPIKDLVNFLELVRDKESSLFGNWKLLKVKVNNFIDLYDKNEQETQRLFSSDIESSQPKLMSTTLLIPGTEEGVMPEYDDTSGLYVDVTNLESEKISATENASSNSYSLSVNDNMMPIGNCIQASTFNELLTEFREFKIASINNQEKLKSDINELTKLVEQLVVQGNAAHVIETSDLSVKTVDALQQLEQTKVDPTEFNEMEKKATQVYPAN